MLFAIVWNFLVLSPVILVRLGLNDVADLVYLFFKPICHQIDSRSFYIYGVKLAVCSRCSLIYLGALLGSVISWFVYEENLLKKSNFFLVLALIPSLVEFLLEKFLNVEILTFKLFASLWLGGIAGFVLSSQIVNMFGRK